MIPSLVNALWQAASIRQARRFAGSIGRVAETQAEWLAACLAENRDTEYGRRHGFGAIRSVAAYQERVPLTVYDDYAAEIARLAAGETRLLTRQPVLRFELSSGSTAASKLIPSTAGLRAEFQRGLAAWIADLYRHDPQLREGPAYWSITPLVDGPRTTEGGIPIGFDADSAYLGPLGALVESTLAVPGAVRHLREVAAFRYATLLFLLRAERLRLISVWNPTFLTLLLAPLREWWEPLLADLAAGTLHPPVPIDPLLRRQLERRLRPAPRRARALAQERPEDVAALWPRLRLLSCWADGPAAPYAEELRRRFPHVTLQPKGLLATEAFVSFPLVGHPGAALATTAHFFEFLADSGEARLAHQLDQGHTYEAVVTTGGGFYRYQLHDVVEVVGFVGQAPCLRFVGKTDQVSDWFGEKLNERFVAGVLERLFARHRLQPSFALVAPEPVAGELRYALYVELQHPQDWSGLSQDLDRALCENFHYAYCRRLGQLAPPRVVPVVEGQERYLRACQSQGQKLGNVKPAVLQKAPQWGEWLGA
ncbi:MAG TPA: GH3 auxin-responsive promoter family protein [Thermoanaerobaculia bacterium]|nr:GH3 auxin-responsive promoter family protein [Thermoanaerobaculia bacterium]